MILRESSVNLTLEAQTLLRFYNVTVYRLIIGL